MSDADQKAGTITALEHRLAVAKLKRARRKVTKQDWATLFRQMQAAATQLATHPFVKGDAEAERRLAQMLVAADLDEMDRALDHLGEYIDGKVAATMIRRGEEPPPPRAKRNAVGGRALGRLGPSGDDFTADTDSAAKPARAIIRM